MIEKTDRRGFLKTGLLTTAAVATGAASSLFSVKDVCAQQVPDVAISHGQDAGAITRAAVEALGGMKRFVKPGNKVVIKPNMSFASGPERASNTDPLVVREVARMCIEAGASRIAVLDNVLNSPQDCLKLSQIPAHLKDIQNTVVSIVQNQRFFREVKIPDGREFKSMQAVSDALDADVSDRCTSGQISFFFWGEPLDERDDGADLRPFVLPQPLQSSRGHSGYGNRT